MVSEKLKNLKDRYQNGKDNIGRDLVGVCLSECSLYRRGTGFLAVVHLRHTLQVSTMY